MTQANKDLILEETSSEEPIPGVIQSRRITIGSDGQKIHPSWPNIGDHSASKPGPVGYVPASITTPIPPTLLIEPSIVPKEEPAHGFLEEASEVMKARAQLRDTPGGERTAKKIAEVFNALTGKGITEEDAWTFLIVLKLVRSRSGKYNRDDYVDLAAYSGLLGECESTRDK